MPLSAEVPATADAYWNLPDDRRAELIDGVLYDMAPPGVTHQRIAGGIYHGLRSIVEREGGPCEVLMAPIAVNLDANEQTWVEPDVLVVCDPGKVSERGVEGAPDLVVEVVSPASRRMDYIRKFFRYESAGVREYWIVDPLAGHTTVYRFDTDDPTPRQIAFGDPVPVGIWGGAASITMDACV